MEGVNVLSIDDVPVSAQQTLDIHSEHQDHLLLADRPCDSLENGYCADEPPAERKQRP